MRDVNLPSDVFSVAMYHSRWRLVSLTALMCPCMLRRMSDRWYRDGLQFECTQCGACCTGAPGYVWVTREESKALAAHIGSTVEQFRKQYLRRVRNRYSLLEHDDGDCVFWDQKRGCTVYGARPAQCRTYPFWPENLSSKTAWAEVEGDCPGSGKGRLYTLEEIERIRSGGAETG